MDAKKNFYISALILIAALAALYLLNPQQPAEKVAKISDTASPSEVIKETSEQANAMPAAAKLNVTTTEPTPGQLQVGTADNPPAGLPEDLQAALKSEPQELPEDLKQQLQSPPPELPDDLKAQLSGPPPELPDDLKAQLNAPPPEIPEDIRQALQTPPREVSIEEVNTPPELR